MKLLGNPDSGWTKLYWANLYLMRWREVWVSKRLHYSFPDTLLFGEVEAIGCFRYTGGLWAAWALLHCSTLLVVGGASLLGKWRISNVLPFLLAFEGITSGKFVWLMDTLARIGIIQLIHLLDDWRTIVERWGKALDRVRNVLDWLKGLIVQFIELIGEAKNLEDT